MNYHNDNHVCLIDVSDTEKSETEKNADSIIDYYERIQDYIKSHIKYVTLFAVIILDLGLLFLIYSLNYHTFLAYFTIPAMIMTFSVSAILVSASNFLENNVAYSVLHFHAEGLFSDEMQLFEWRTHPPKLPLEKRSKFVRLTLPK